MAHVHPTKRTHKFIFYNASKPQNVGSENPSILCWSMPLLQMVMKQDFVVKIHLLIQLCERIVLLVTKLKNLLNDTSHQQLKWHSTENLESGLSGLCQKV